MTGSNFLLDTGGEAEKGKEARKGTKILIDCGLVQGQHAAEKLNWEPFKYDPSTIDTLVITHAHIDHIGRIPKLVKDGFRGKILSTVATKALAEPMLQDAHNLLDHTAKALKIEPLYGVQDIEHALKMWDTCGYHDKQALDDDVTVEFYNSGHILGSAMARFTRGQGNQQKSIVFTGDLGGNNSPLLDPAETLPATDYLVMESVYGDRTREDDTDRRERLAEVIRDNAKKGGTLFMPTFSTERTQDLLFEIRSLFQEEKVPSMPVYVDSPLALKITAAFKAHPEYFAKPLRERVEGGEDIFDFPELHLVEDAHASEALTTSHNPKIIMAGSGMSNGGRALYHEAHTLPDPRSTVLIVGYQAAGSLGRRLIEGAKKVEIMHMPVDVKATVLHHYGYSAHMDTNELLAFVEHAPESLKHVFVVMGEPASSMFLAQRIRDFLGIKATTPEQDQKEVIEF